MLERLVNICKNNPKLKQVEIRDVIERRFGVDLSQASVSRYIGVVNTVFNELRNKSRSESEDKKQPLGEDSPAD